MARRRRVTAPYKANCWIALAALALKGRLCGMSWRQMIHPLGRLRSRRFVHFRSIKPNARSGIWYLGYLEIIQWPHKRSEY